jgi:BNR/Asp-box repeat protein
MIQRSQIEQDGRREPERPNNHLFQVVCSGSMPSILSLGASLALGFVLTSYAYAGVNFWTGYGPPTEGAAVTGLAVDPVQPTTIYAAGSEAGLFRSTDGGRSWSAVAVGQTAIPGVTAVAIDPVTPTTIYAGAVNAVCGGCAPPPLVYKSTDGGKTWSGSDAGLPGGTVLQLVIAPSQPATLYLNANNEIFKSSDGGRSWTHPGPPRPPPNYPSFQTIEQLAVDPQDSLTVFYADFGGSGTVGGIFKSTDGGDNWTDTQVPMFRPNSVVIDPHNPSHIYTTNGGEFASSTDGGTTWVSEAAPSGLETLVADRQNPPALYGSVFAFGVLNNAGLSSPIFSSLAVDASGTYLYAGTQNAGVFDYEVLISRQRLDGERPRPPAHQVERRP